MNVAFDLFCYHCAFSTFLIVVANLLSLLKWRTDPSKLYNNLEKLMKLEGEEIMKVGDHPSFN
jgi:hypothetical protein